MNPKVENLKGKLIVSCQALPDEPLHSSFIMGRMALAAKQGGASGIRANTPEDIKEIKTQVDLPVIGIIKRNYDDCEIYITPTIKEIDELMEAKPEIIALDATISSRPKGQKLDEFFHEIKEKYPDQLLMADCSTIEEALHADELGFDFIGTTMVGYTKQSSNLKIDENDFEILRTILSKVKHPVIAEGNINTPEKLKRVLELGAFCAVVGSAITRPQLITKSFARIHCANLINAGILPLNFKNPDDYDKISEGDLLGLKNVKDEILSDKPVMLLNETTGEKFELKYDLSTRQKDIILAGGLLNYTRESL